MTERVYPILPDDKMNFMMDKQKALREKLAHYKKIKNKWSCANTALKITGISLSCILCGASILTMTPFSIPIAAAVLGGISLGNTAMTNLLTERFTSSSFGCSHSGVATADVFRHLHGRFGSVLRRMPFLTQPTDSRET